MVKIKRFNVEFTEKDPFDLQHLDIKDIMGKLSYDWHFEEQSYLTKKATLEKFNSLINVMVTNRDVAEFGEETFFLSSMSDEAIAPYVDPLFIEFSHGLFSRMVKTSKVIQNISVEGNYIEAKALLRTNFEKAVLIQYFVNKIKELPIFLKARAERNSKLLKQYSIKNMAEEIKRDYTQYKYLCLFVHPHGQSLDAEPFEFDGQPFLLIREYNEFLDNEFFWINQLNNNLLVEVCSSLLKYYVEKVPKKEITGNLKRSVKDAKKLKMIVVADDEEATKRR